MRTIDKIITKVNCRVGAPMCRPDIIPAVVDPIKKVFNCRVPMCSDGAYDSGGAYWGIGRELRVKYTKDLTLIQFYRLF